MGQFATLTAQSVIDTARMRHHTFTPNAFPDGGLLLELDTYQRQLLSDWAKDLMPLVGAASSPLTPTSTTTPTFILPNGLVHLDHIWATYQDTSTGPVDLVDQWTRFEQPQTRDLACYLLGGTIFPVRDQPQVPFTDGWLLVASLTVYGIFAAPMTNIATATMTLPDALVQACIAHLAATMAVTSKDCPQFDKGVILRAADAAEAKLARICDAMTGDAMVTNVIYRGQ